MTSSNAYNTAGNLIRSVDSLGLTTTYSQTGYELTNTVVAPGGITNVTKRYVDGRTKSTSQSGELKRTYNYGGNLDGTQWTTTYTGPSGTNSPAWQKTTTDFLGRTIKTESPGFGGMVLTNETIYNNIGQVVKTTSTGRPDSLFVYNVVGEQTRSGTDIDGDGTLDIGEMDRVSESDRYFEQDASSDWWQVSVSKFYPNDNEAAVVTNSIQRQRLTGLGRASDLGLLTSEAIATDLLGNQTIQQTHIDRDNKEVIQLVNSPSSTTNQERFAHRADRPDRPENHLRL